MMSTQEDQSRAAALQVHNNAVDTCVKAVEKLVAGLPADIPAVPPAFVLKLVLGVLDGMKLTMDDVNFVPLSDLAPTHAAPTNVH